MSRNFDLGLFVNPQQQAAQAARMAHGNVPMGKPKMAPPPAARGIAPLPPRQESERPIDPAMLAAIMEGKVTPEQARAQSSGGAAPARGRRGSNQAEQPQKSYTPSFKDMPRDPGLYNPEGMHVMENTGGRRDYGAMQGSGHFNAGPSGGATDSPIGAALARATGTDGKVSGPIAISSGGGGGGAYSNPEALAATKDFLKNTMGKLGGFDVMAEARGQKTNNGIGHVTPIDEDDDPILSPLSDRRINFNQSGIFEVVITEDDNGLKAYDVVSPHGTTIAKDMSLHEAAEALTMCFNRGLFVNSVVVRNIIDADYAYTLSRREAAKAKSLYESARKKGNESKAEEYARKFDEYRIKAKKAQSILQEALSGRR